MKPLTPWTQEMRANMDRLYNLWKKGEPLEPHLRQLAEEHSKKQSAPTPTPSGSETSKTTPDPDLLIEYHGSHFRVLPLSAAAVKWMEDREDWQPFAQLDGFLQAAEAAGLYMGGRNGLIPLALPGCAQS